MEKWWILFAVWSIFGCCFLFTRWIYAKEEHLVWCNDYDVIESLQGESRERYIARSKQLTYRLFAYLMIIFSLPAILPTSNYSFILMVILAILVSIICIYKDIKNRKQYTKK